MIDVHPHKAKFEEIKKAVSKNKLDDAIYIMEEIKEDYDIDHQDAIDLLANNWTKLKKDQLGGSVPRNTINLETNGIIQRIFSLCKLLSEEEIKISSDRNIPIKDLESFFKELAKQLA